MCPELRGIIKKVKNDLWVIVFFISNSKVIGTCELCKLDT